MSVDRNNFNIPLKANKVLNIILAGLLLIMVRIWHLAVIQHDSKVEEAAKPQHRFLHQPAKRGTIRDRFNIPLAINKIQYNAAVVYAPLQHIPKVTWKVDSTGNKIKIFNRKEHIKKLSLFLGKVLEEDPERIEDLIYSKAALYHSLPFVIKRDISESQYYQLKMQERDCPGIHVQIVPKRFYPLNKVAGDVIGYMGAINRQEYEVILEEMQTLDIYLRECDEGFSPELPGGILSHEEALGRLKDLKEYAFTINDTIGKAGIEGRFEQELRGYRGERLYYADAKGNFLHEIESSRAPIAGRRLILTISAELQAFAEKLLAQNERIRTARASKSDDSKQVIDRLRQPWIKGGGILAMDPSNGEILAFASFPRVNPNDFVVCGTPEFQQNKRKQINRWFENEGCLADIWDGKQPMQKEIYDDDSDSFIETGSLLTWETYLNFILPSHNPVYQTLSRLNTIRDAVEIQRHFSRLAVLNGQNDLYLLMNTLYSELPHIPRKIKIPESNKQVMQIVFKQHQDELLEIKRRLNPYFSQTLKNYDKVLLVDICRLVVDDTEFSDALLNKVGSYSLSEYRQLTMAKCSLENFLKEKMQYLFHHKTFHEWRRDNEKNFLKEKRLIEKEKKQYSKPYIDYLDNKEKELFSLFWRKYRELFFQTFLDGKTRGGIDLHPYTGFLLLLEKEIKEGAHQNEPWMESYRLMQKSLSNMSSYEAQSFLRTMRDYRSLTRPLYGRYPLLRKEKQGQVEKNLASAFHPQRGFGYGRSQIYRQAEAPGSIFKLMTAYAALVQQYATLPEGTITPKQLNPLEIVDQNHRKGKLSYVGFHSDGSPLPRLYKGGILPRTAHIAGKIDLLKAIEHSSNPYFSILAGDVLSSPDLLTDAASRFGFGLKTGVDLPAEISGRLPNDLNHNRSGLYALAIGQHSLMVTPLQTGVMLSALANGGKVFTPKIIRFAAGEIPKRNFEGLLPLFESGDLSKQLAQKEEASPLALFELSSSSVRRELFLPDVIRRILLEGMRRVVLRTQKESLPSLSRFYNDYPEAISDYIDLKNELIGKTSTAESLEFLDLDSETGTNLYTHVWFGGISFEGGKIPPKAWLSKEGYDKPELVVVVYLRYGSYGKEAAPIAAQIVTKWREIKSKLNKKQ